MDAQVVYERQTGGNIDQGPCEFVRVGVRFDDRVFWIESSWFPGSNSGQFKRGEELAKQIVHMCTADHSAGERKLRGRVTMMLNELALDRERQANGPALFTPYIEQCNVILEKSP